MGAEIIEVSERSYGPAPGHDVHEFWQVVLPIVGALAMRIDGSDGVVDRERFAALRPGTEHVYRARGANRFLVVDLALDQARDTALSPPLRRMDARMTSIIGVFRAEAATDGLGNLAIRNALGSYVEAALAIGSCPGSGSKHRNASSAATIADRARAMIESEPDRAWSIDELAHGAYASPRHLSRCFQAVYGITPAQFARSARLSEAKRLLAAGAMSAGEAAARTGFTSQSHFTRTFVAEFGLTPGAWQRSRWSDSVNSLSETGKNADTC